MKYFILYICLFSMCTYANTEKQEATTLRMATFNVSMEALNYLDKNNKQAVATGNELNTALNNNHQQIKNIAEIIQRINPDIILLNEFDNENNQDTKALKTFINHYLAKPQNNQQAIKYPYFYQAPVNTGVILDADSNNDGKISLPVDAHGFGYFAGHFGMALLSKYPIDVKAIRSFQHFKWQDMPNALKPIDPITSQPWYSEKVWQQLRLSSKSHWDIPVLVDNKRLHVLSSHPTPPVFDGPEDRNGKRNHDEIRFWTDYLQLKTSDYIYDDNKQYGGLANNSRFVILGDLNASATEGDAINSSIASLINHSLIQDPKPESKGAASHTKGNDNAKHHTAYWRMRADYVLPSQFGLKILDSGVFWPSTTSEQYSLINSRHASSDHRLVWVDIEMTND